MAPMNLSRRSFLGLSAALPFALRGLASGRAASGSIPVGLELYSVREALKQDPEGTVRAVAQIGYQAVEFYSPYFEWTDAQAKQMRKLMDDLGQVDLEVNGVKMIFRHQTFDSGDRLLQVFYSLCSDYHAPDEKPLLEDGSQASRLRAVLTGKRNLGQQMVEVVIVGPESDNEATAVLKKELPSLIRPL